VVYDHYGGHPYKVDVRGAYIQVKDLIYYYYR
jgi:hypothetical protein